MDSLENQARSAVAALGKRGKTSRVPTTVREIVLEYTIVSSRLPSAAGPY